jgi:hypothetical protein
MVPRVTYRVGTTRDVGNDCTCSRLPYLSPPFGNHLLRYPLEKRVLWGQEAVRIRLCACMLS